MSVKLDTAFIGMRMKNPTILASGILGVTKASISSVIRNGAGAATIKSISREKRKGHNNPILLTYSGGMMNAVGYSNPGLEEAKKEFVRLAECGGPVIGSIIGQKNEDFAYMAKNLMTDEFSACEVALSCPHTPGFGMLAGQGTPEATADITETVRKNTKLPVIIKLSPNIPNLADVAKAAVDAGADAINMGNSHGPGMVINIETKQPVLDFKIGGVSGPGIRPIAVRCVYDLYKVIDVPIIGTGGVTTWRDAVEMMMAGASAVGVGTAVYYKGIDVFAKIASGMKYFMEKEGYSRTKELIGAAHD